MLSSSILTRLRSLSMSATEPDARRGRERDGGGRAPEDGGGRIPAGAGVGGNAVFAVAVMACAAWLFLFVVLLTIPSLPGPRRGGGPGSGQGLGGGQGPGPGGTQGSGGEPPAVISL